VHAPKVDVHVPTIHVPDVRVTHGEQTGPSKPPRFGVLLTLILPC
jgi:hypothetical protein